MRPVQYEVHNSIINAEALFARKVNGKKRFLLILGVYLYSQLSAPLYLTLTSLYRMYSCNVFCLLFSQASLVQVAQLFRTFGTAKLIRFSEK